MQVTTCKPAYARPSMGRLIDSVLTHPFAFERNAEVASSIPAVNIMESENKFLIQMVAPGWEKQDFQVSVEQDQLVIGMEKQHTEEEKEAGKWIRKEFIARNAKRRFHLDQQIDTEGIEASYINGILYVTLPKRNHADNPAVRRIDIQ